MSEENPHLIELTKKELQLILHTTSKDAARINLYGVFFGPGFMVSTNGHALAVMKESWVETLPKNAEGFRTYARDGLDTVAKLASVKGTIEIDCEKHEANIWPGVVGMGQAQTVKLQSTETNFPPYLQVIPRFESGESRTGTGYIGMGASLLGGILAAYAKLQKSACLRWQLGDSPLDPTRLDFNDRDSGRDWTTVVMPMRI